MRAMRPSRKMRALSLDSVEVEVRLEDVLRQGGLVYPVESVSVERVWYCTLPMQFIEEIGRAHV